LKDQQYDARTYHNISTIQEKCDGVLLERKKEGIICKTRVYRNLLKEMGFKNIEVCLSDVAAFFPNCTGYSNTLLLSSL
jgi:hypothetical protein